MAKQFVRDVVSPRLDHSWEFSVDSNLEGLALLEWDISRFFQSEDLYLYDVSLNKPVNMKEVSVHSFNSKESKTFRIYFGKNVFAEMLPDKAALAKVYPNPTKGTLTTFAFILPESGGSSQLVSLKLFDPLGKPVALIKEGEFTAGYHEIDWQNDGKILSDGLYLFRLNVIGNSGQENLYGKLIFKQ
jgi:hypothetical protein